jgi:hypothetical protein
MRSDCSASHAQSQHEQIKRPGQQFQRYRSASQ